MNIRLKIFIDKFAGIPIVFILNFLLLIKKRLILKRERIVKHIIICKFMGMGSIIQSTPMIKSIRMKYPTSEITFLTTAKNYDLIKLFTFIDSIVTINEENIPQFILTTLQAFRYLRNNNINIFIDLEIYSCYSKIFSALSSSDNTIGFFRKGNPLKGIYTTLLYFDVKNPVKTLYLGAARIAGCEILDEELENFSNTIYHDQSIAKILNEEAIILDDNPLVKLKNIKNYLIINPNASNLRFERRWPAANYIDLINQLLYEYPELKIVMTGSLDEKNYVNAIYDAINEKSRNNVINTAGSLNLNDFIFLVHNSSLMLTNDSGPMHIAFALKKKTIALFGPCSPVGYMTQENAEFVYRKIHCSPCVHDYSISPCKGDNQCMKLISVNEVMNIFHRIIIKDLIENPSDISIR